MHSCVPVPLCDVVRLRTNSAIAHGHALCTRCCWMLSAGSAKGLLGRRGQETSSDEQHHVDGRAVKIPASLALQCPGALVLAVGSRAGVGAL
jgi:hypothetical protein